MTETELNQNHVTHKRIRLTLFFFIVRISSFALGDIGDMHPRDKAPCATRKITFVILPPPRYCYEYRSPSVRTGGRIAPSTGIRRSATPQPQSLPKGPRREETFADIHSAKAESRRMIGFARSSGVLDATDKTVAGPDLTRRAPPFPAVVRPVARRIFGLAKQYSSS
jgi:hypothetical protein